MHLGMSLNHLLYQLKVENGKKIYTPIYPEFQQFIPGSNTGVA